MANHPHRNKRLLEAVELLRRTVAWMRDAAPSTHDESVSRRTILADADAFLIEHDKGGK
jgi:hypothetical protein